MATMASKKGGANLAPALRQSAVFEVAAASSLNVEGFLIALADVLNTTTDFDALLHRIAELVRRAIPYEIFAIMLLNEKAQDLRMRFQIGHSPEIARIRVKLGTGITGQVAQTGEPMLVNDVTKIANYIEAHPCVRSEMAVPLIAKNRIIGVIDIQSNEKDYFKQEHLRLLTLVASRIAVAIENARLYHRVTRQARTLQVLNEISRDLTSILKLDELLRRVGELLSRVIDFHMFSILLLDKSGEKLQHRFSLRFRENIQLKHDIPLGLGLVGAAAKNRAAVLAPDVLQDERYISLNPETRSELCVPLIYKDGVIGVLDLEHTRPGYFTEEHVRTITTLAAQIAIAIENAQLYERVEREENRLERDLAMAREVQMRLLPPCCPLLEGAELAAAFSPAAAIGGDIYDFIDYSGARTAIAVGDVSGKGAAAALFAAMVGGMLRTTSGLEPAPSEMLMAINASLNERRIDARFVSLLYAVWDDEQSLMQIANSGQPRPIYCHHGRTQIVEAAGIPLGLFEDVEYDEFTIHAQPGDIFVFFSDGILDAQNPGGELFGRARVEEIVRKYHELSANDLIAKIFDGVRRHSSGVSPFDDETIVIVKIKPNGRTAVRKSPAAKTKRSLREI